MTRWSILAETGPLSLTAEGEGMQVLLLADPGVVLHRVRLSAKGGRARLEEAGALAAGLSAIPQDRLHLSLGAPAEDGSQWLAIIARERMDAEMARLEEQGVQPDRLVPAAGLLPDPVDGAPVAALCDGRLLVRGERFAGAAEPELAAMLGVGPAAPALEEQLPQDLPETVPDLLAGPYAPRQAFWNDRRFRLAAGLLVAAALVLALVPWGVGAIRGRLADEARDTATLAIASRALGRELADPVEAEALIRKEAAARPDAGLGERLALSLAAIEAEPQVSLSAMAFAPGTGLSLTLAGPAEAIQRVVAALARSPWDVQQQGERLRLGPRAVGAPAEGGGTAEARLLAVRELSPMVALSRRAPQGPAPARLGAALASAGIAADVAAKGDAATARLDAVRAGLLLPLIARLEASGTRIVALDVRRNDDPSLSAMLEVR